MAKAKSFQKREKKKPKTSVRKRRGRRTDLKFHAGQFLKHKKYQAYCYVISSDYHKDEYRIEYIVGKSKPIIVEGKIEYIEGNWIQTTNMEEAIYGW